MVFSVFLPLVFCVAIFIHGSDGACQKGDVTHQVGETWREESPECVIHTCLDNGLFSSSPCEPEADSTKGSTTSPSETTVSTDLPTTTNSFFDYSLPGCTVDTRVFKVGEQYNLQGQCVYRACMGNNRWIMKACGLIGLTPGWGLTPEDTTQPYPNCCGRAVPLLDIVPDVIQDLHWNTLLDVSYGFVKVDYGNEFKPSQVKNTPEVHYTADPAGWYLLGMVDPDAPSRLDPKNREFLHWLVGNIPGNNITAGEVLAEYVGAGPPKGTDLHRYVFLLYLQPEKLNFDGLRINKTTIDGRRQFSINKFAHKYGMNYPSAFNSFQAQWDESVPELQKQLGVNFE